MTKPKPKDEREYVNCYNCNQKWCMRYGQFNVCKCADHPYNRMDVENEGDDD